MLQICADKNNIESGKGAYILWLQCADRKTIQIGKFAAMALKPGLYGYVGSAMGPGGIRARVGHHLRLAGNPRWHIDYLRAQCPLVDVWYAVSTQRIEHEWVAAMAALPGAQQPVPGFGASDHRGSTHLFLFGAMPTKQQFLGEMRRQFPELVFTLKML